MKYLHVIILLFIVSCKLSKPNDKSVCEVESWIKVYDNTLSINFRDSLYVPDSLFDNNNIKTIFLTGSNCISSYSLFESISRFEKLEELYIHNCNIKSIPDNINKLSSLKILRISDDSLDSISVNIRKLNIESLILEHTNIGSLNIDTQNKMFKTILSIPKLSYLSLYNNQIDSLPEDFLYCNITQLNVAKNKFKKIPSVIIMMINKKNLCQLEIDYIPNFLSSNSELNNIVKRDRRTYIFYIYFDRELSADFTKDVILKLTKKYPVIEGWGNYIKR